MRILLFTFLTLIFFVGCSQKGNATRYFENSEKVVNSIQYTKKIDFNKNNENKIAIITSYLNNINKVYKSDKFETFLIAIQNLDDRDLIQEEMTLELNGRKPLAFTLVDKKSKFFENIAMKNHWAEYFLVKFPAEKEEKVLELNFFYKNFGEEIITFEK